MLFNYQEFLDGIDRAAYHEGEWQWEEDGYTVTRTYTYSAPGCHDSCGVLMYVKDGKLEKIEGDPLDPCANGPLVHALPQPRRGRELRRAGRSTPCAVRASGARTSGSASRGTRRSTRYATGSTRTWTRRASAASPSS